jgi:hypothetical protein
MPEKEAGCSNAITEAIEDYLRIRPQAADTLEGIACWWLSGELQNSPFSLIQHAVDELCRRGVLHATRRSGKVIYQSAALVGSKGSSEH